jgi:hypothetical protein
VLHVEDSINTGDSEIHDREEEASASDMVEGDRVVFWYASMYWKNCSTKKRIGWS